MLRHRNLKRAFIATHGLIALLGAKGGLLHGAQETVLYRQDYAEDVCLGRVPHGRSS